MLFGKYDNAENTIRCFPYGLADDKSILIQSLLVAVFVSIAVDLRNEQIMCSCS